jgi:hypothetical protein
MLDQRNDRILNTAQAEDAFGGTELHDLLKRSQAHEKVVTSVTAQEILQREKVLPKFDLKAEKPEGVFTEGLRAIFPREIMASEGSLAHQGIMFILRQPSADVLRMPIATLYAKCRSALAVAVVRSRALADVVEPDDTKARRTAQQFGLMNCMHELLKMEAGAVVKLDRVSQHLQLEKTSVLAKRMFDLFFEPIQGNKGKKLDLKLQCHMYVWALHLTPTMKLDLAPVWEYKEHFSNRGKMKDMAEYIGCEFTEDVTKKTVNSLNIKLKAPFKISPPKGAGRGAAKKRRK